MSVRPYPSRDRALRHLRRRHGTAVLAALLPRAAQPSGGQAGERLKTGLAALPNVGDYVLSARRGR